MLQTWQKKLPIFLNPIKTAVRVRILVATLLKILAPREVGITASK